MSYALIHSLEIARPVRYSEMDTGHQAGSHPILWPTGNSSSDMSFTGVSPCFTAPCEAVLTKVSDLGVASCHKGKILHRVQTGQANRCDESEMCKRVQIWWRMGHCGSAHSKTCCIAVPLAIILTWMCRMHERVTEKPMGKLLASTSFSSIFASHAISMAVSSSHGLMLHKIINCCIEGFHEF